MEMTAAAAALYFCTGRTPLRYSPRSGIIQCIHSGEGNPLEYIISGVAVIASNIAEINLNFLRGIFPSRLLILMDNPINKAIESSAPSNAPLMSTNVRAASADEFSIDSRLTR